jgi:hypothetical protein
MTRGTAEREAAEREHAAYEPAQRETAERLTAAESRKRSISNTSAHATLARRRRSGSTSRT